jgi:hypothetical protein
MKRTIGSLVALVFSFGLVAQSAAQEVTATAQAAPKNMHAGLRVMMLPLGTNKTELQGSSVDSDLAFAFGLSPFFDYTIIRYLGIGLGPEFFLNVKGKDYEGDASKALNLNLRIKGMYPVLDQMNAYLLLTPGYSIILPPEGDNPKGFNLGFAGGVDYNFTPMIGAFAEVGYILGFQSVNDVKTNNNYMQFNIGAQANF